MKDRYEGMNLKNKSKLRSASCLPYSVPWVELVAMFFLAEAVTQVKEMAAASGGSS